MYHPFASLRAGSEHSEGSLSGQRSFAVLRMTRLHRLRLTRKTPSLKCIGPCPGPMSACPFLPGRRKRPLPTPHPPPPLRENGGSSSLTLRRWGDHQVIALTMDECA